MREDLIPFGELHCIFHITWFFIGETAHIVDVSRQGDKSTQTPMRR